MMNRYTEIIDKVIPDENKFIRALIQSAQLGNNAALEQLYEMNLGKINAFGFLLTGSKSLAENITIDTFVYAWNKVEEIDEKINFTNWLKKIALNFALEHLKNDSDFDSVSKKSEDIESLDDQSSPILKIYPELENKSKFVLTLNFIENYTASDLAKMLGIDEAEVAKRITDSIIKIGNDLDSKKSVDEILQMLSNLPTEILPERNILKSALDNIYEQKLDEFEIKEKEDEEKLKEELLRNRKEYEGRKKGKPKPAKKEKRKKQASGHNLVYYVAASLIFITGFIYITSLSQSWTISVLSGSADINNAPIVKAVDLSKDDILHTNVSSSGEVIIPDAGKIVLFPSTIIKRTSGNQLEFTKGKIKVVANSLDEFPEILTGKLKITNYQAETEYELEKDNQGNISLGVKFGWLKVDDGKRYTVIQKNYSLKISARQVVGLPYFQNSDKNLIALINDISFEKEDHSKIIKFLDKASYEEAITLWNLLKRVNENQKGMIYDKLYELVPPPDQIPRQKMLSLDDESMIKWFDEIKWQL